ncbi:putative zn 2cys6 transcription factor protein [Eutypa lata UCREL1]|uniref:Putative zn 2cys6 transcription factor protein n=1 Tax=Eutypa lata (strain UCR-EL1) TaxID=1287681 RepID=M7SPK8_EUTLA|nr:putative zn 2cys6 transcription factor protein [Eutypa lata UCREL1]
MARKFLTLASRLVTRNDELVCSLEGVECIMIESLYHHNAGNLHRAWLAARRAMAIAQIIGLYRRAKWSSLKVLDPEARARISPGSLWFRVVHADRYFSLMLGLPQGSSENSFATPKALESCDPFERLERMAAVVAGRILQIRDTKLRDFDTTYKIDELLLEASESMPTEWWPTPDLASDENTAVRKAIRIMG